jgi:hypothetical protein
MGQRMLVPDADEVVLDLLIPEGRTRLVMVLRLPAWGVSLQSAYRHHIGFTADISGSMIFLGKESRYGSSLSSAGSFVRRKAVATSAQAPLVLTIDDRAWRKGRRYRTILCDLERG